MDNNRFERLQADPTATMPPPGPREGSPIFFTTTPDYLFNASLTVVDNFKVLSLQRGWAVGSTEWCSNWRACFGRNYTRDQNPFDTDSGRQWDFIAGFQGCRVDRTASVLSNFRSLSIRCGWAVNSPTWRCNWLACFGCAYTEDQNPFAGDGELNFFATFPDYHADRTASVLENFKRLSRHRRWGVGSKIWCRQWRACFGRAYTEHDNPFDDSDSDSDDEGDESGNSGDSGSENTVVRSDAAASFPSSGGQPTNIRADRRPSLAEDFAHFFGYEGDKLENWQRLCRIVGLDVGISITQCRKILGARDVMINLVNLVRYMRGEAELIEFGCRAEFVRYTRVKRNMFSRAVAKDNGFLRALLRKL